MVVHVLDFMVVMRVLEKVLVTVRVIVVVRGSVGFGAGVDEDGGRF